MLAREVARPVGDVQGEGASGVGLVAQLRDDGDPPAHSPQYRCSRHGSP